MNNEVIVLSSKTELLSHGYSFDNVGKEFIYEGLSFLLKENGIRNYTKIPFFGYSNPRPEIIPRNPKWVLKVKDIRVTVTDLE
tara:strand:- start:2 stop:250 length:249 start_codon:yes stop_codon:yes gene_type:complete